MNASGLKVPARIQAIIVNDMREYQSYNIADDTVFVRWDTEINGKIEMYEERGIPMSEVNSRLESLRDKAHKHFKAIEAKAAA